MTGAAAKQSDPITPFGVKISRDTLIYVSAVASSLPFSLVLVAVLTRFLEPAEYGELAIMFVFSGFLTIIYNTFFLQGIFMWVFGAAEDADVDARSATVAPTGAKRAALGSGLVMTVLVAVAGSAIVVLFASPVADWLLGDSTRTTAVVWAAVSAGLGSLWRLVVNVFRLERQAGRFAIMSMARPVAVLLATIPLLELGYGVEGALAGTAAGTALGVAVCLLVGRRNYAPTLRRRDVTEILRRGRRYIPILAGLWVVHNGDLYLLSRLASDADVGVYRLAARLGSLPSYFVSAVLMSLATLERTSLFTAAYRSRGEERVRSHVFTYFVLSSLGVVLFLAIAADVLVRVAAPSYSDAAALIPIIGFGFVTYGAFVFLSRVARINQRTLIYGVLAISCGGILLIAAWFLIKAFGAYGAAIAPSVAMGLGALAWLLLIRKSDFSIPFEGRRIVGGVVLMVICLALATRAATLAGRWQPVLEGLVLLAYPVSLVAVGIVPRKDVRRIGHVLRGIIPWTTERFHHSDRLARLDPVDRRVVEELIRHGRPVSQAADRLGLEPADVTRRLIAALRVLADLPPDSDETSATDEKLATVLIGHRPAFELDDVAAELWDEGVDPFDLHELQTCVERLRRVSPERWTAVVSSGGDRQVAVS